MIQGLNITVQITRDVAIGKDVVGGAIVATSTIATGVLARISNLKPTEEQRIQGIEETRMFNMVVWPATVDIRFNDYIYPESGDFVGLQFRVLGVQKDSLPATHARAHISVRLQRVEKARSIQ